MLNLFYNLVTMKGIKLICLSVLFVLFSCRHEPIIHPDPEIEVTLPVSSTLYNNGDTIHVDLVMRDENALHEASVYLRTAVDTMIELHPVVHELDSFELDTFYIVSGISTGVDGFLTVIASNKHDGETVMNVPFFMVP